MKRKIKRVLCTVCTVAVMFSSFTTVLARAEEIVIENTEIPVATEGAESGIAEVEGTETTPTEQVETTASLETDESVTEEAEETTEQIDEQEEQISIISTDQTYTDENGNVFTYVLDELGNATITGITLSGTALIIPSTINDAPVVSVANGNNCVVSNPEIKIPELVINCHTIGIRAFYGVSIGTLTIGADVKELCVNNGIQYDFQFYYEQFANSNIDKVLFLATELVVGHCTGDYADEFYGPFRGTSIGELEIGSGVTLIPEKIFADSILTMDTLEIQAERVGAYAFSGENITIHNLIIGENVKVFEEYSNSTELFHHWEQFSESTIGMLKLYAPALEIQKAVGKGTVSSHSVYAPFMNATVGELEIGTDVTYIPDYFLNKAVMDIESLTIHAQEIGAKAFSSERILIGTLTIGAEVATFSESFFSKNIFHYWQQFEDCKIGHLVYLAESAVIVNDVEEVSGISPAFHGPFEGATVLSFTLGTEVTVIPDYLLKDSVAAIEELNLHMSSIGTMAFFGEKISIGKLTLGKEVEILQRSLKSSSTSQYWQQFAEATIGEVHYNVPSLQLDGELEHDKSCYGPFYKSKIGKLHLSEEVERYPSYCFIDAYLEQEALEIHAKSIGLRAFSSSNISIGTLTIGTELETFENVTSGSFTSFGQFMGCTIGKLVYLPVQAETGSDCDDGIFESAAISGLEIHEDVAEIPNYLFYQSLMELEKLNLNVPVIGRYAFSGSGIKIQELTIGTEVETFVNETSGYFTSMGQFMDCTIGRLVYLPVHAETGDDCDDGVFEAAVIGALEIHDAVEAIPNYLFYQAIMELEELTLNVPVIGYYAFAGSKIKFQELTIGESVTAFPANDSNYSRAFDSNTIGMLYYNATEAKTEKLASSMYGAFALAKISGLSVGENVKLIPNGCFRNAYMDIEELTLDNLDIGYAAFYSSNIKIGTLNIGKGVNYTGVVSNRLNTFQNATIGTLNYNSNSVEPEWSTSTTSYGMFSLSTIGQLNIGEDVETIPASWFRSAALTQDELTLSCGWSYDSFCSDKISIGTLTLTGDMAEITHVNNNNMAFAGNKINTVIYDIPSAVFASSKSSAYGPFFNADITNFVLSERVEYIDYRLLRDNQIENCYVYAVNASESYKGQTLGAEYLPVCTNLHIHYNSAFKEFFSKEVTEYHWLCVDYFDTSYGEKFYDEETGTYSVEVFKTCSVCGYEENDVEELDSSYDIYISIPIEVPLAFDSEKKAYAGSGEVYAYGTLGNAYQGVRLVIDKNAESYGKAAMGEDTYDISSYLSVGFGDSEETVFETGVLNDNASCIADGQSDSIVKSQMEVSVSGIAFLESGAGDYKISIPLRFELVK